MTGPCVPPPERARMMHSFIHSHSFVKNRHWHARDGDGDGDGDLASVSCVSFASVVRHLGADASDGGGDVRVGGGDGDERAWDARAWGAVASE